MALELENDREAFLAVLSLVVAADHVGSLAERDFLLERLSAVAPFTGSSKTEIGKLLGEVTQKVYDALPNEGGAITPAGVDQLLETAKSRLSAAQQKSCLELASGLAKVDDGSKDEARLLEVIKQRFGG